MLSIFRRIPPVLVLVALLVMDAEGQAVNSYARVTKIATTVLTISTTAGQFDNTNHTFAVGEPVVIMQMQGKVNADTTNTSSYGTLSSIGAVGQYEVRRITALSPGSMTLDAAPSNSYTFNGNSSVQVISMQELSAGNYTSTANITGIAWNGFIGGVVAINVPGTFTLNHNITLDGGGFRGGAVSVPPGDGGSCLPGTYASTIDQFSAGKGEGIFKIVQANQKGARARVLNGGGGGNVHNAGGAGGGNNTAGGDGGIGYSCGAGTESGGIGGISLASSISNSRVFMGGGGGGGHQNNNVATAGGNGGGIVLIQAGTFATTGSCSGRTISVNGVNAASTPVGNGNDGAGGAGAGGSVVFQVGTFSVVSGCPMTVSANGANGGTVNDAAAHGGGGAGGEGRILYSGAAPANVTNSAVGGSPGCSNSSCSVVAGSAAAEAPGSPGTSAGTGTSPLPVSLIYFTGTYNKENDRFNLQWATATEINNKYFTIQRSDDGSDFTTIAEIDGNGTTVTRHTYNLEDKTGFEKSYYYRLYQTDLDGTFKMLGIIHLTSDGEGSANAWAYPNPVNKSDKLTVDLVRPGKGINRIALFDMQGRELKRFTVDIQGSFYSLDIDTGDLPAGVYSLVINSSTTSFRKKVVVK